MRVVRRAARTDENQAEIVRTLEAHGCTVQSLASVGAGVPDLLVGYLRTNHLLEVKSEKGKLRDTQVRWIDGWRGAVHVVRTPEEALRAVGVR